MTALEIAQREMRGADWRWRVVEAAMFAHAASRSDCRGWTIGHGSMCKATCGQCGWEIAARMEGLGAAVFAMVALSMIGTVMQLVDLERRRIFTSLAIDLAERDPEIRERLWQQVDAITRGYVQ